MRVGNGMAAALVVAAAGTFAPGCEESDHYEPFGLICAAPFEGEAVCVPAEEGPDSAWASARLLGELPIEMWVDPPEDVTLDDLLMNGDYLLRWFDTMDKVIEYVRDTERNPESHKRTLEGRLSAWLKKVKARQKEVVSGRPMSAADRFKNAVTEKVSVEKDPLIATLASDKLAMSTVQEVFENAKVDIGPYAEQYASLAKDFSTYRATEAAETEGYATLAADASKAALDGLDGIEQAIVTAALDASAKPTALASAAMKLSAQIQQFELTSQEALEPHAEFMATHGAVMPDMTSAAQRSLNAMLGYIDRRVARSDATATALIIGVGMRRKALQLLAGSSAAARAQMASAKLEKASGMFAGTSDVRVSAIKSAPPMNKTLELPYLAKRYDELTRLLQMQPLCDPASASWREAGCTSLRLSFDVATIDLKTTLPSQVLTGLATMKAAGVEAALLDAAKAKLDAGDLKAAAVLHDAALRSAEGT